MTWFDSWVSFVSINFQPCLSSWCDDHACKVQSNGGCWQSKKLQVRGRFFKKLYRDGRKLPRRQEADSMTATCWHSQTLWFSDSLCLGIVDLKCVKMMPCRIGMNVECFTVCQTDQGLSIKGSMKSGPFWIIVIGSTKVGFMPALVTHEEVEIWAEGEEVKEEPRKLDDWEVAERKTPRRAKIVAVPLAKFDTCAHRLFWSWFPP